MTPRAKHSIVDSHLHLWNPSQGYKWLAGPLRRAFTIDDAKRAASARDFDIAAAILVEADRGVDLTETTDHLRLADHDDFVAGVVGELPDPPGRLAVAGFAGHPKFLGIRTSEARLMRMSTQELTTTASMLSDLSLTWQINAGPAALSRLSELDRPLEVNIVLDHLGCFRPDADEADWLAALDRLADPGHLSVKLSGMLTRETSWGADRVHRVLELLATRFGSNDVLIGSDWPICLRAGSLTESVRRSMNAASTFFGADPHTLAESALRAFPRLPGRPR